MKLEPDTIDHVFKYHAPVADQIDRYHAIREAGKEFAWAIIHACPPSEERTLALRDVQRAVMMANASIALNESVHEVPPNAT